MKKFYIQHHFTSLFVIALVAAFITIMYYAEVAPAEANQALTATPVPVELVTPTAAIAPVATPGDTTGIVLWGFVIVAIIFSGLIYSRRDWTRLK
jgi:hypothetical protein